MTGAESVVSPHERRDLYLDRRVCTVTPDRIDIHPARSIVILPLFTLAVGVACFPLVFFFGISLPLWALAAITLTALVLVPVSGVGLVYSIAGANVVIDRWKQSAVVQQGYLGMGVGTQELVPFWKVDYVQVRELLPDDLEELAQFEVAIVKVSGREVDVGSVTVLRSEAQEGLARAREVAALVAEMTGSPVRNAGPPAPGAAGNA